MFLAEQMWWSDPQPWRLTVRYTSFVTQHYLFFITATSCSHPRTGCGANSVGRIRKERQLWWLTSYLLPSTNIHHFHSPWNGTSIPQVDGRGPSWSGVASATEHGAETWESKHSDQLRERSPQLTMDESHNQIKMTVTRKSRLADEPQTASRLHKREGDRMNVAATLQKRGCPSYLSRASWHTRQAASVLLAPNDKWFFE